MYKLLFCLSYPHIDPNGPLQVMKPLVSIPVRFHLDNFILTKCVVTAFWLHAAAPPLRVLLVFINIQITVT